MGDLVVCRTYDQVTGKGKIISSITCTWKTSSRPTLLSKAMMVYELQDVSAQVSELHSQMRYKQRQQAHMATRTISVPPGNESCHEDCRDVRCACGCNQLVQLGALPAFGCT
ncbi:hypothetical protein CHS0354_011792 [Potamilus streckersoni]|uniref:Uncharacterized protein n=1 Tax=Potamilus streckersoni TaxID=2493646 RepID=A0AAE0WC74_9BIVA|nr:hypothetical protein CHS0354_011792 [Potamilus streckersoni]